MQPFIVCKAHLGGWFGLVLMLAIVWPSEAFGAGNPAAEALFREARKLLAEGDIDQACTKFGESQRLEASTGTLLNLANCHALQGKTASAWAEFAEALAEAQKEEDALRVDFATKKVAELEPKLSRITVLVATPIEGLSVSVDGQPTALDSPLPHDPGSHEIKATAPGKRPFTTTLQLGPDADSKTVTIPELELLAKAEDASGDPPVVQASNEPMTDRGGDSGTWREPTGYTLGSLGLVAVGVGTYFALAAQNGLSDAENDAALCPNKSCTPQGRSQVNGAETKANVATGAIAGGIVAIGVGAYLLLSGNDSLEGARLSRVVAPTVHDGQLGLSLYEEF